MKAIDTAWREPYLFFFLPLGVISGVKCPYKKKNHSPENETCVRARRLFLSYFIWIKLWRKFSNNPHSKQDTQHLRQRSPWTKVKPVSRVFLLFVINVKDRRSLGNERLHKGCTGRKKAGIMHLFEKIER